MQKILFSKIFQNFNKLKLPLSKNNFFNIKQIKYFSDTATKNASYIQDSSQKLIFPNLNTGVIRLKDYILYLESFLKKKNEQNLKDIQKQFLDHIYLAKEKNIFSASNFSDIMPLLIKSSASLNINSLGFWKIISDIFSEAHHKIGTNIIFNFLSGLEMHYSNNPNVNKLKDIYFNNLTRNKVLAFNLETALNYLNLFYNFLGTNSKDKLLLQDLQKLILVLVINEAKTITDKSFSNQILNILQKHEHNQEKNLDILFSHYLKVFTINFSKFDLETQLRILNIYFKNKTFSESLIISSVEIIEEGIQSLFSKNHDAIKLNDMIDIIEIYSYYKLGTLATYLQIEKFIGLNINEVKPDKIFTLLKSFVNAKKYREKFPLILQKKINDCKYQISLKDLSNIIKIYADLRTDNFYIFDKLHNHFINTLTFLSLSDLSKVIYSYSYAENNNNIMNYEILKQAELLILDNLSNFAEIDNYEAFINITYSYFNINEKNKYSLTKKKLQNFLLSDKFIDLIENNTSSAQLNNSENILLIYKIMSLLFKGSQMNEKLKNANKKILIANLNKFDKNELKEISDSIASYDILDSEILNSIKNIK